MTTSIGQSLTHSTERLAAAALVSVVVLLAYGTNLVENYRNWQICGAKFAAFEQIVKAHETGQASYDDVIKAYEVYARSHQAMTQAWEANYLRGMLLAFTAIFFYLVLSAGDYSWLGLVLAPNGGWLSWCRTGLIVLVAVTLGAVPVGIGFWAAGVRIEDVLLQDWRSSEAVEEAVLWAPLREEIIFRMAICVPVIAVAGPRSAIAISGFLFACNHLGPNGPNPVNFIGGFFLAWSYLRSGSLLVPILFHSVGNAIGFYVAGAWLLPMFVPHAGLA
jgi:hypothetical protein